MNKNAMNSGSLAGLEHVNLTARARRQVERQISFAAMIVDMVIKAPAKRGAQSASVSH